MIKLYAIFQPDPKFIEGGQSYLTRLPGRDGRHGYWKHLALVTANVYGILVFI